MPTELRPLTEHQYAVLLQLRLRGAHFTAECAEFYWRHGQTYYLDRRNHAANGLRRVFNLGNQQATRALPGDQ